MKPIDAPIYPNGMTALEHAVEHLDLDAARAALAAGATSISSVQFSSPSTDEARRQAITLAVSQAQKDADALARAAGGSLGRLLTMSSTGLGPSPGYYPIDSYSVAASDMMAGGAVYPTMINPRDMTVAVSVFGRWEFIPGASR